MTAQRTKATTGRAQRAVRAMGAVLVALACVGTAVPAQAADSGRLQGRWTVKSKIVQHTQNPHDVGNVAKSRWTFKPSCAAPDACTTTLVRKRSTGHPKTATTRLKPSGSSYAGTTSYKTACFLNNGGIVENAYTVTEKTALTVLSTNGHNVVTKFSGKLVLRFAPTAAGRAHRCGADKIALKVHS